MIDVLILGASGGIARVATGLFLANTDARLTLHQRRARRVTPDTASRIRVVEADVRDAAKLQDAIAGQDVVHANLAGDLEPMARSVVKALHETDYETTQKARRSRAGSVSRRSVAAPAVELATLPGLEVRRSLGGSKPE